MARAKRHTGLTLKDKLSRLTYAQVAKLLGDKTEKLLALGGAEEIVIDEMVTLDDDRFELSLPKARVTITLDDRARGRLMLECDHCPGSCEHMGAALSLILEEKLALGLAAPRPEAIPLGALGERELLDWALAEREKRATNEKMVVRSAQPETPWTDYMVTNRTSGRAYRVALRCMQPDGNYCSCPDFRTNTLGTCKHIIRVQNTVKRRFKSADLAKPYERTGFSVVINYGEDLSLRLLPPHDMDMDEALIAGPYLNRSLTNVTDLLFCLRKLEAGGSEVTVYPDAEELIQARLLQARLSDLSRGMRSSPTSHPLKDNLLKSSLLPHQVDGIAFAVGAGRAILADDMGLGKTIQGIGTAELYARECDIKRVLVVCPASLKAQWRSEIERFSTRPCTIVAGPAAQRAHEYLKGEFFTICNYEQVLKDIETVEQVPWDLIILDEGQRIKNWEAKTSRVVKGLKSRFALVLTGTPLENRLDDLFSIVAFIDDRRLGPAFRFFNRHRVVNEKGRVLGYEGLDELREKLAPLLLRRTRRSILKDLPERTTTIVRVEPTEEQKLLHDGYLQSITAIVRKKHLNEMDLLRLQKALLACRMAANSTFLITKETPGHSSKLKRLEELLCSLAAEEDRKIVLFSEWTTMVGLIEPLLDKAKLGYVRLDGKVPQSKRQALVDKFQNDPQCRAFITTNAGSTGLNLQAADTVINVDLPWNPAVLEQRIARAHRMGQERRVQVFIFVTEDTLEERLLATLSAKHQLALAALDMSSDVQEVSLESGLEELKRRLEILLGAAPDAPVKESQQQQTQETMTAAAQKERIAAAGGQLIQSAFSFLGEILPQQPATPESEALAAAFKKGLSECLELDEHGNAHLTVTLSDPSVLDNLAQTLAGILPLSNRPTA